MKAKDRRVERTRALLQRALLELIQEKGYDAVTVQDITEHANVGRATFYLHYQSKDDLFFSGHKHGIERAQFHIFNKEELLAKEPPERLVDVFRYAKDNPLTYYIIGRSKDATIIMRNMKHLLAGNLETSLREAFPGQSSTIPIPVLTHYVTGSFMSLIMWWIESRAPQSPEEMAAIFHRLQRAAICEAYGLLL
jgi:AcrR family transcriptional regulator